MSMGEITPTSRYQSERGRIETASGTNITTAEADAILDVLDSLEGRKANSTLTTYGNKLRMFAEDTDASIVGKSVDELTDMMDVFIDNRDYSDGSIKQAQSALIAYVRHHIGDDDADEIQLCRVKSRKAIDERTVLNPDEFHAMRDAAPKMRDRALIDLLGYTGQRLRVIQNLKIKDINIEEGVWYMPDAEGLKGADKTGKKRPLLAARKSVSEWMQMHPTGNPDDYFITCVVDNRSEFGDRLGGDAIRRQLRRIAADVGIDKPVNPHSFRHFFVTVAKAQYGMDDETIRHLIGHGPGSRIMETTYSHLSDDDHIAEARRALGIEDGDDEAHSLTPPVCPTCGTPLSPGAETCPTPTCTEQFLPDGTGTDPKAEAESLAADIEQKMNRLEELKAQLDR